MARCHRRLLCGGPVVIAVMSQSWVLDLGAHRQGFIDAYATFGDFHRAQPGFQGRRLMAGISDAHHMINVRYFDRVEDYEEMIKRPGYADHIDAMSAHIDITRVPPKEYVELIFADDPAGVVPGAVSPATIP